MKINQAGLDLIKQFEGCRLEAYKDIVGVVTIGYGHTGDDVYLGQRLQDQNEAEELLKEDLTRFEVGVSQCLLRPVTSNQFSALVCFAYNVGLGALLKSHLLIKVNGGSFNSAADEFLRWDRAGGKQIPGLLRRREAEKALFLS